MNNLVQITGKTESEIEKERINKGLASAITNNMNNSTPDFNKINGRMAYEVYSTDIKSSDNNSNKKETKTSGSGGHYEYQEVQVTVYKKKIEKHKVNVLKTRTSENYTKDTLAELNDAANLNTVLKIRKVAIKESLEAIIMSDEVNTDDEIKLALLQLELGCEGTYDEDEDFSEVDYANEELISFRMSISGKSEKINKMIDILDSLRSFIKSYYDKKKRLDKSTNTWQLLHFIAESTGLGFAGLNSTKLINDNIARNIENQTYYDYIKDHVLGKMCTIDANKGLPDKILNCWVDLYGYLTVVDEHEIFNADVDPKSLKIYYNAGIIDQTSTDIHKSKVLKGERILSNNKMAGMSNLQIEDKYFTNDKQSALEEAGTVNNLAIVKNNGSVDIMQTIISSSDEQDGVKAKSNKYICVIPRTMPQPISQIGEYVSTNPTTDLTEKTTAKEKTVENNEKPLNIETTQTNEDLNKNLVGDVNVDLTAKVNLNTVDTTSSISDDTITITEDTYNNENNSVNLTSNNSNSESYEGISLDEVVCIGQNKMKLQDLVELHPNISEYIFVNTSSSTINNETYWGRSLDEVLVIGQRRKTIKEIINSNTNLKKTYDITVNSDDTDIMGISLDEVVCIGQNQMTFAEIVKLNVNLVTKLNLPTVSDNSIYSIVNNNSESNTVEYSSVEFNSNEEQTVGLLGAAKTYNSIIIFPKNKKDIKKLAENIVKEYKSKNIDIDIIITDYLSDNETTAYSLAQDIFKNIMAKKSTKKDNINSLIINTQKYKSNGNFLFIFILKPDTLNEKSISSITIGKDKNTSVTYGETVNTTKMDSSRKIADLDIDANKLSGTGKNVDFNSYLSNMVVETNNNNISTQIIPELNANLDEELDFDKTDTKSNSSKEFEKIDINAIKKKAKKDSQTKSISVSEEVNSIIYKQFCAKKDEKSVIVKLVKPNFGIQRGTLLGLGYTYDTIEGKEKFLRQLAILKAHEDELVKKQQDAITKLKAIQAEEKKSKKNTNKDNKDNKDTNKGTTETPKESTTTTKKVEELLKPLETMGIDSSENYFTTSEKREMVMSSTFTMPDSVLSGLYYVDGMYFEWLNPNSNSQIHGIEPGKIIQYLVLKKKGNKTIFYQNENQGLSKEDLDKIKRYEAEYTEDKEQIEKETEATNKTLSNDASTIVGYIQDNNGNFNPVKLSEVDAITSKDGKTTIYVLKNNTETTTNNTVVEEKENTTKDKSKTNKKINKPTSKEKNKVKNSINNSWFNEELNINTETKNKKITNNGKTITVGSLNIYNDEDDSSLVVVKKYTNEKYNNTNKLKYNNEITFNDASYSILYNEYTTATAEYENANKELDNWLKERGYYNYKTDDPELVALKKTVSDAKDYVDYIFKETTNKFPNTVENNDLITPEKYTQLSEKITTITPDENSQVTNLSFGDVWNTELNSSTSLALLNNINKEEISNHTVKISTGGTINQTASTSDNGTTIYSLDIDTGGKTTTFESSIDLTDRIIISSTNNITPTIATSDMLKSNATAQLQTTNNNINKFKEEYSLDNSAEIMANAKLYNIKLDEKALNRALSSANSTNSKMTAISNNNSNYIDKILTDSESGITIASEDGFKIAKKN